MITSVLPVSFLGVVDLSDLTAYYQYQKCEPTKDQIYNTLSWFKPVDNIDIFLDITSLNDKFEFDFGKLADEDRPYNHKALGIAIIALLSTTTYSDKLFYSMCEFVYSDMKKLLFTRILAIIAKSIFPNFSNQINKTIENFIKNNEKK